MPGTDSEAPEPTAWDLEEQECQAPAGDVGPRTKSPRTTVSHTHVRMSPRVRTGVSRVFLGNGHLPLRFALEPS